MKRRLRIERQTREREELNSHMNYNPFGQDKKHLAYLTSEEE